jgi:hypothetical protein
MADLAVPNGLPITITRKVAAPKSQGGGLWLWFITIQFPDGVRSAVVLGRITMPPAGDAGWHAILTVADAQGGLTSGTPTAAHFDQRMAQGDVLYWFMHSSDRNYARGLWSRDASAVTGNELAAYTWGMNQLVTNVAAAVGAPAPPPMPVVNAGGNGGGGGGGSSPGPMMQPQQAVIVAAPPVRRWPVYLGTVLVIGGLAWLVLD